MRFVRAYTPDHFWAAQDFSHVMRYIKLCVRSSVQDAWRQHRLNEVELGENDATAQRSNEVDASELWGQIDAICKNRLERRLARAVLIEEMKPREILQRYPEHFSTVDQVKQARQTLMKRIRRRLE
jgi:hypothetical protein